MILFHIYHDLINIRQLVNLLRNRKLDISEYLHV